jgi:YVTN family beta-propeller protein
VVVRSDALVAYVANPRSASITDEVLVIDVLMLLKNLSAPDAAITARIPVQDNPLGIALTDDQSLLVVANANSDTVSLVDTSAGSVIATVPVGHGPEDVAVTPDASTAYVTDVNAGTVSVVDLRQRELIGEVPVGVDPGGIAISRDGAFAYVANSGSRSVSVIGIPSNVVVATIPVGMTPEGVALSADATRLYVANDDGNSVTVIDARSIDGSPGTIVLATVPLPTRAQGPFRIAFTADRAFAYVTNSRSGNVAVIDTAAAESDPAEAVRATIRTGDFPHTVAVSRIAATELQELTP